MDEEFLLTTIDNPYSPFTQYDDWYAFDTLMGYNTCGLLAREAKTSDDLSDADNALAIDEAMDVIVKQNVSGVHLKVNSSYVPRTRNVEAKV